MHDLNTINRLNLEAFASSIHTHRAAGRYVLARYEGAHLVSIETFSGHWDANETFDAAVAAQHGGERNILYAPLRGAEPAPGTDRKAAYDRGTARAQALRDQSEDRAQPYSLEQLAALGRTGEHTLADYIARKEGTTGGVPVLPANEN